MVACRLSSSGTFPGLCLQHWILLATSVRAYRGEPTTPQRPPPPASGPVGPSTPQDKRRSREEALHRGELFMARARAPNPHPQPPQCLALPSGGSLSPPSCHPSSPPFSPPPLPLHALLHDPTHFAPSHSPRIPQKCKLKKMEREALLVDLDG